MTESYAGFGSSPATVSKPAPAGAPAAAGAAAGAGSAAKAGVSPREASASPSVGSMVAAAVATASPLSFTLRVPAESAANFAGGEEEQQRQLLAAFERALPGAADEGDSGPLLQFRLAGRHPQRTHHQLPPVLSPAAEGSAAELEGTAPAADGSLMVTMAASLPRGSSTAAEEAQYMAAVLQNDAKQVGGSNGAWLGAARQPSGSWHWRKGASLEKQGVPQHTM